MRILFVITRFLESCMRFQYRAGPACKNFYLCFVFQITSCITLFYNSSLPQANVLALCMVTREFIKQLRERNVDDGNAFFMNRYAENIGFIASYISNTIYNVL